MNKYSFTKKVIGEVINPEKEHPFNLLLSVGDINGDGRKDIVIAPRNGRMVWFENRGPEAEWKLHDMAVVENIEAGGELFDITGNGLPDIVAGGDYKSDEICWWKNPGPSGGTWQRFLIARTGMNQFHDQLIGDVTNEGRMSLVFWNQGARKLLWCYLPERPEESPWPGLMEIAAGVAEEGLSLADIDLDGKKELIAGTHWYKYINGKWEQHRFAEDYICTRVAVGDINGDGRPEIVLAEGDACIYGKPWGGKLAWFSPGKDITGLWEEHILDEGLLDPHSLQLGDINGRGILDIFVGEIGREQSFNEDQPKLMIYENDGKASFTRHIIDRGTGTHQAVLADFHNRGVLDIAGKPLHGPEKWKVHIWYNNCKK